MKTIVVVCALMIQLMLTLHGPSGPPQRQGKSGVATKSAEPGREWQPGTYRGLTAGKSTRADALRLLGQPQRQDSPADQAPADPNAEVWYVYNGAAEFLGELTIVIEKRTDVVRRIDLSPEDLSRAEAVKHFGPDYILTRYDFDECLGDEESAPLYESASGPLLQIEYRHRGLAVSVDDREKVRTISYVSEPIGASQPKCKLAPGDGVELFITVKNGSPPPVPPGKD